MNARSCLFAAIAAAITLSGCGGGGNASRPVPSTGNAPGPVPSASGASGPASLTFRFTRPAKSLQSSAKRRRPLYLSPSTESVSIFTTNTAETQFFPLTYINFTCAVQTCTASTTANLAPGTYDMAFFATDQAITDPASQLSGPPSSLPGNLLSQVIATNIVVVKGANSINVTLDGVVDSFGVTPQTATVTAGTSATIPVALTPYDADGNLVTGAYSIGQAQVSYQEMDIFGAFSLAPGTGSTATCQNSTGAGSCTINSPTDTIVLQYNGSASGFAPDPGYFPAEVILAGYSTVPLGQTSFQASSTASVSTAVCTTPKPLCVYSRKLYPLFAGGNNPLPFSPNLLAASGTTIFSDAGVIGWGNAVPSYTLASLPSGAPISSLYGNIGALAVAPGGGSAWATDIDSQSSELYNFPSVPGADGLIDTTLVPYTPTLANTVQGGSQIVAAPDGNIWWIDQQFGNLLYASPSSLSSGSPAVNICILPSGFQVGTLAANSVSSASTFKLWFTALDQNQADPTANEVVGGAINFSHTGNHANTSCGTSIPFAAVPVTSGGYPFYSTTVDNAGRFWMTDPGSGNLLINGVLNGSGAPVFTSTAMPAVPAGDVTGDPVYAPAGGTAGYVYFIDGVAQNIVRFDPSVGASSAAVFDLPAPIVPTIWFPLNVAFSGSGSAGSIMAWSPGGTGGLGYLDLIVGLGTSTGSGPNYLDNQVVVGIDLGDPNVAFTTAARRRKPRASRAVRPFVHPARGSATGSK